VKLTWHNGSGVWSKVIGKRVSKAGQLIQAQHYFTSNREQSEAATVALKAEWQTLKKRLAVSHRPHLELMKKPFPETPR
jgi:hypothetical protein